MVAPLRACLDELGERLPERTHDPPPRARTREVAPDPRRADASRPRPRPRLDSRDASPDDRGAVSPWRSFGLTGAALLLACIKANPAFDPDASASAAVIEVRTGDRSGLLFALANSLSELRLSIRSAHVSTLAGQAIDTFYLTEADGSLPSTDRVQAALTALTNGA